MTELKLTPEQEVEAQRLADIIAEKAKQEARPVRKGEKWWVENTTFADLLKHRVEHDGLTDRPKATPSSTARTSAPRLWRWLTPENAPRASGSACGVRSPAR